MKQDASFFDETYFDCLPTNGEHKSNYTAYGGYRVATSEIDWQGLAHAFVGDANPVELYILDIGCAYGYLVQALRNLGVNAFGMDISEYALSQAPSGIRDYLFRGDITKDVPSIPGQPCDVKWGLIISLDVLEHCCGTTEEARELLTALGIKSRRQHHKVNTGEYDYQAFEGDRSHCLRLPLVGWRALAEEARQATGCEINIVL